METSARRWQDIPFLHPLKMTRRFLLFRFWPAIRPFFQTKLAKARHYVGAWSDPDVIGEGQLELLKISGCKPDSQVLEVGCGCLIAGLPIIGYLKPDHYVGIEPNVWLIEAAKKTPGAPETIESQRPVFLNNSD